ncbi:MAG: hypothetical protein GY861_01315 [bacterium]|nr:hypothetical protein [bacterium]
MENSNFENPNTAIGTVISEIKGFMVNWRSNMKARLAEMLEEKQYHNTDRDNRLTLVEKNIQLIVQELQKSS